MAKRKTNALVVAEVGGDLTLPEDWASELAPYVDRDAEALRGGVGNQISTKNGVFSFNGEVLGEDLQVVILGGVRENAYYEGVYNPAAPEGPSCFALDLAGDESEMAPPTDLKTKQADKCSDCWANVFGSDDRGRGKKCKNTVRVAVLPNSGDPAEVDIAVLRVPPTSLGLWSKYAAKLIKGLKRPLFSALTNIHIKDDESTQFKLEFGLEGVINDRAVVTGTLKSRADEARPLLEALPEAPRAEVAKARGNTRKKVNRRKASGAKETKKKVARKR